MPQQPTYNSLLRHRALCRWDVTFVGSTDEDSVLSERSREMAKYNQAIAEINDEDNLIFEGKVFERGGHT